MQYRIAVLKKSATFILQAFPDRRDTPTGAVMRNNKRQAQYAGWIFLLGFIIIFGVVLPWITDRVDRWRFPWGYPEFGSSLTGVWVGPLVTGTGKRLGMLIDMELVPLHYGSGRPEIIRTYRSYWLEGDVLVCAKPGRVQHFYASGKPEDTRTASRFHLSMTQGDTEPLDGLSPSYIQGRWNGKDSLTLAVSLYLRKGKSAISDSADPDIGGPTSVTLRRGTEADFESLCNGLRK